MSTLFSVDMRARPERPDHTRLPVLHVDSRDPASGFLATLSAAAPADVVRMLREAPARTIEVRLRLAKELIDDGDYYAANKVLDEVVAEDAWEWRAAWLRGVAELARGRPTSAAPHFREVYLAVPGELAPKLALGVAYEASGEPGAARPWYEIVSRTDPSYTNAAFGLARCCVALGDRDGALEAYAGVEERSSTYTDARVAIVHCLLGGGGAPAGGVADLAAADQILRDLDVDPRQRAVLTAHLLASALALLDDAGATPQPDVFLAGRAFVDRDVRAGLEAAYRSLARLSADADDRIAMVDAANRVRPRTWT